MNMYLNLSPGPSNFQHFFNHEQAGQMIPHGSLAFAKLYRRVSDQLRLLLNLPSQGEIVFLPSSGTGGIEALLLNALKPGDKVLILANGYFGERLIRMTAKMGFDPYKIESSWEYPIDTSQVLHIVHSREFEGTKAVVAVHLETSTGLLNDIASIGKVVQASEALFLVDAVSSVGPHPIEMKDWGIDGLVTVSYKGLFSPPGLSILALGERYCARMEMNDAHRSYYFDLKKMIEYASECKTTTTLPSNTLVILEKVLGHIIEQDQHRYSEQCHSSAQTIRHELTAIGYRIYGRSGHSHAITAVNVPAQLAGFDARDELERCYGTFVGGGLGRLQGKVLRIAHYGNHSLEEIPAISRVFHSLLTCARFDTFDPPYREEIASNYVWRRYCN